MATVDLLKYKKLVNRTFKPITTISNTQFTYYYYTFLTQYEDANAYSDLLYSNMSLDMIGDVRWYTTYNFNSRTRVDEFENEFEERVPFMPKTILNSQSSITTFFSTNMIDIPRCLEKSTSLYKPVFAATRLKFLNILMRHGRKEQIFTTVLRILVTHKLHIWNHQRTTKNAVLWLSLLPTLSTTFLDDVDSFQTFNYLKFKLDFIRKNINKDYLIHNEPLTMLTVLTNELNKYKPIFAFKTQKVDKLTRKHSRGKSGKYVILWKYIPVYRRIYTVLRWLIQDLTFQKTHKFETRFLKALEVLQHTPIRSMVYKCRNFNHNFVFKNFKKTLLQSLQTVS